MKFSKQAFILWDALIGFFIFSIVLMLFIPSYYNEVQRMYALREDIEAWELLVDIAIIQADEEIGGSDAQALIARLADSKGLRDIYYDCSSDSCWLRYKEEEIFIDRIN